MTELDQIEAEIVTVIPDESIDREDGFYPDEEIVTEIFMRDPRVAPPEDRPMV